MKGTKMTLKRYAKPSTDTLFWETIKIVVDSDYLELGNGLYVYTDPYTYVTDIGQLEVHFNGHFLTSGGGYEEIDGRTIKLNLGTYPLDYSDPSLAGRPVMLKEGDEIHIRIWKIELLPNGGGSDFDVELLRGLASEVIKARRYKEDEPPYIDLDDRLDSIERRAETKTMVFVIGKVSTGVAKIELRFPYEGVITEIYASCSHSGEEDTVINIEKCSQEEYDTTANWTSVLQDRLTVDSLERSSRTSTSPYSIKEPSVDKDDHFRVNIESHGVNIEGLVIEVVARVF